MNCIRIKPGRIKGSVKIPPSKSMAHRAIICASLSKGVSRISNIDFSDDIIATIDGMRSLGAEIEIKENLLIIDGTGFLKNISQSGNSDLSTSGSCRNTAGDISSSADNSPITVDCNESGSTLRFLIPISIAYKNHVRFIGKGNLGKRPLNTFYDIFDRQKIEYSFKEDELNLVINGKLQGDIFEVKGNISSQFISGLLFTLPLLEKDSKIVITTVLESKGYIDLTLDMLNKFGIEIVNNNYREFLIRGGQSYRPMDYKVEGDYSQAAFFFSANALGNNVDCLDLDPDSFQGDKVCIDILEKMETELHEIDASQCPDIIPVLTVVASLSKGETRVINGQRLRIKECDRLNAICTELNKLGANIVELDDGLIINGVETLKGGHVHSHKDHRIAMSLAIASTRCEEDVILEEPDCVSKSYPDFWKDFKKLGGQVLKGGSC